MMESKSSYVPKVLSSVTHRTESISSRYKKGPTYCTVRVAIVVLKRVIWCGKSAIDCPHQASDAASPARDTPSYPPISKDFRDGQKMH